MCGVDFGRTLSPRYSRRRSDSPRTRCRLGHRAERPRRIYGRSGVAETKEAARQCRRWCPRLLPMEADISTLSIDCRMPPNNLFPAEVEDEVKVRQPIESRSSESIGIEGTSAEGGRSRSLVLRFREIGPGAPRHDLREPVDRPDQGGRHTVHGRRAGAHPRNPRTGGRSGGAPLRRAATVPRTRSSSLASADLPNHTLARHVPKRHRRTRRKLNSAGAVRRPPRPNERPLPLTT